MIMKLFGTVCVYPEFIETDVLCGSVPAGNCENFTGIVAYG